MAVISMSLRISSMILLPVTWAVSRSVWEGGSGGGDKNTKKKEYYLRNRESTVKSCTSERKGTEFDTSRGQ